MPPFPKLPLIDPEILLGLMLVGAIIGALGTGATYIGSKMAETEGRKLRQLPEIPGLVEQV